MELSLKCSSLPGKAGAVTAGTPSATRSPLGRGRLSGSRGPSDSREHRPVQRSDPETAFVTQASALCPSWPLSVTVTVWGTEKSVRLPHRAIFLPPRQLPPCAGQQEPQEGSGGLHGTASLLPAWPESTISGCPRAGLPAESLSAEHSGSRGQGKPSWSRPASRSRPPLRAPEGGRSSPGTWELRLLSLLSVLDSGPFNSVYRN